MVNTLKEQTLAYRNYHSFTVFDPFSKSFICECLQFYSKYICKTEKLAIHLNLFPQHNKKIIPSNYSKLTSVTLKFKFSNSSYFEMT